MPKNKKISKLKTGMLSRSYSLARLGLGAGLKFAVSKVSNQPFENYLTDQAATFTKELGELKGSVMKAGQMLSVFGEHFLPPEANAMLKTLQSDSKQVEWSVMETQLEKELSEAVLSELHVEREPIGAASMGQVYLATVIATGERIALKIQYPGVDTAVDSDVAALKKLMSISKLLPKEIDTTPLFEEVKIMLRQELDYRSEAELTEKYGELIRGDHRFKVPKVFRRYCSDRVLATEYVEGLKPDHSLVLSLPQKRRNRLAENFLDLYFKELFKWQVVQTDPHPGNYKIQLDSYGNDVIVLLDFGAVKIFEDSFMTFYRQLVKGAILNDEDIFFAGARGLGFINDTDSPDYVKYFKEFCRNTVEPFWRETPIGADYDWKANDLPNRVVKSAFEFRKFKLRTPPRELVFLDRKTAGVFMILHLLGAQLDGRQLILPYLDSI